MENLLTNKTKIDKGVWEYRGFVIEKQNNIWIVSKTPTNFTKFKGLLNKGIKKVCLELDSRLGTFITVPKDTKTKTNIIQLDLDKLFFQKNKKKENHTVNKQREEYIFNWFNPYYLADSKKEDILRVTMMQEFNRIGITNILSAKKLGGKNKCDFQISYIDINDVYHEKFIEFKSHQNKSLSFNTLNGIYLKNTNFLNGNDQEYIKFYFDNYIPKIRKHYNIKDELDFETYKKHVYRQVSTKNMPKSIPKFLSNLYILEKKYTEQQKKNKTKKDSFCNTCFKESVDLFLASDKVRTSINIPEIEKNLVDCLYKKKDYWLVWNQLSSSFKISKTQNLKILGYEFALSQNKEKITGFSLKCVWLDKLGNELTNFSIKMLLRWKNRNGVFGCAYQFS